MTTRARSGASARLLLGFVHDFLNVYPAESMHKLAHSVARWIIMVWVSLYMYLLRVSIVLDTMIGGKSSQQGHRIRTGLSNVSDLMPSHRSPGNQKAFCPKRWIVHALRWCKAHNWHV